MRIDLVPQVGTHSAIGDQVNLASEPCFQILPQADKIEKTRQGSIATRRSTSLLADA
jgi:hypothetical protein